MFFGVDVVERIYCEVIFVFFIVLRSVFGCGLGALKDKNTHDAFIQRDKRGDIFSFHML